MRTPKRRFLVAGLFVLLLALLYWLQRDLITFSEIVEREMRLRSWIEAHPVLAFAAGFGAYVLLSMIPGTPGKSVVFGWFYGFWQATIIIDFALTIAATIAFLISRYIFLELVEARLAGVHRWLTASLEKDGPFYLLSVRLMHAPYTLVNYAAGATGVRAWTFWWTTQLGLLPGTIVCALVGSRLPTLAELQDRGLWSLLDPLLIAGLVVTAALPLVFRFVIYLWRKRHPRRQPPETAAP